MLLPKRGVSVAILSTSATCAFGLYLVMVQSSPPNFSAWLLVPFVGFVAAMGFGLAGALQSRAAQDAVAAPILSGEREYAAAITALDTLANEAGEVLENVFPAPEAVWKKWSAELDRVVAERFNGAANREWMRRRTVADGGCKPMGDDYKPCFLMRAGHLLLLRTWLTRQHIRPDRPTASPPPPR